jgi:hypothetical protein
MTVAMKPMGIDPSRFTNQRGLSHVEAQLVRATVTAFNLQSTQVQPGRVPGDSFHRPRSLADACRVWSKPCYPKPPVRRECCHPQGSLKTDSKGVVTTPGGYKIEATKEHEWIIKGPDGKSTRIWGDPHVDEGDGGKWDFKRDSTFVLGDGTRINVTTKPWANNMTVTGGLEIISGNDRVQITDIDKGKGKTGPVTHDGFQHVNSFGGKDVFVMGKETDDWSFKGREVIGSNNGGESFKLGKQLPAGTFPAWCHPHVPPPHSYPVGQPVGQPGNPILPGEPHPHAPGQNPFAQQLQLIFQGLSQLFQGLAGLSELMSQRHYGSGHLCAPGMEGPWMDRRHQHLGHGFDDIGRMMDTFVRMTNLSRSVTPFRGDVMA